MLLASQVSSLALVFGSRKVGDIFPRATLPSSCSLSLPGFQMSGLDDNIHPPFRCLITARCIEISDSKSHCEIEPRNEHQK